MDQADVIVIGGGPGGYVAAMKLAMNGKKTILIEKENVGGTCLNRGCIPTKALIHCSDVLDTVKNSAKAGICVDSYHVDTEKINTYKDSVVKKLVGGVSYLLSRRGVQVVNGRARIVGAEQVEVTAEDGSRKNYSAKSVILAVGSGSAKPPIDGINGKNVITSTEALDVSKLPRSLVVIGGGVIGMEIGSTYARFGVEITVLEALPRILPMMDSEVTEQFVKFAEKLMKIETGARVLSIVDSGGEKKVIYEMAGQKKEILAEKVLVCVGRKPETKDLGLESAGVKTSERGYILVDEHFRTTAPNIYAIGDVNGKVLLAHAASAQAIAVAENLCGKDSQINTELIPSCIYTKPEIASVGKTEDQLKKENIPYRVGRFPLSANGKALSMGEPDGFVKILTGETYGEILGAHVVGARATDLIGELALAMNSECTVEELIHTVHAHPTISEAVFEAAEMAYFGQAVHFV